MRYMLDTNICIYAIKHKPEKAFQKLQTIHQGKIRADLEKKGTPIGPLDMMIAGHAQSLGYTVVTNNVREFSRVSALKIENWAE